MNELQPNLSITRERLVGRASELRDQGYRLAQIGATPLAESTELNYSFDRAGQLLNLRLVLEPGQDHIPSISTVYGCAFIYENELHDLFHLHVDGLVVDFRGQFYKTRVPFPFAAKSAATPVVTVPPTAHAATRPTAKPVPAQP